MIIMSDDKSISLTSKNLDQLADFLSNELANPTISSQIPDGAHIFHGSYKDSDLTQGNLKLAIKILLGMTLGYVEEAPLMMVFEQEHGEQSLLNLSEIIHKKQAEAFIGQFEKQNQKKMTAKLNQLLAV